MKKKIVFHSNYHKLFTGFGKNAKNILKYLYKTGKYDLIEVANGKALNDPELSKSPWKTIGSLPKPDKAIPPEERNVPEFQRRVGYGVYGIDEIIAEEKPDIYLGVEDVWAFDVLDKKNESTSSNEDDEFNVSLAKMEEEIKPKIINILDSLNKNYSKLQKYQKEKLECLLNSKELSVSKNKNFKKIQEIL